MNEYSRREFLKLGVGAAAATALAPLTLVSIGEASVTRKPVVAITSVRHGRIGYAVEEAIDLLGGVKEVAGGERTDYAQAQSRG